MSEDKNIGYLNIAGCYIKLNFKKTEWHLAEKRFIKQIKVLYYGFFPKKPPRKIDFTINFLPKDKSDLIFEKNSKMMYVNFFSQVGKKTINTSYQISLFHFQMILSHILKIYLAKNKGFFMHSSGVENNGRATLFVGPSGAGKSTSIKLLKGKASIIADDSVVLKEEKKRFYIYQTPFYEKEWWGRKQFGRYELDKILLLKQADKFKLEKIKNKSKLFQEIFQQLWRSEEDNKNEKLILKLINNFDNFYFLYFKKDSQGMASLLGF